MVARIWLTQKEAEQHTNRTTWTLWKWRHDKQVRAIILNDQILYDKEDLTRCANLMKERRHHPDQPKPGWGRGNKRDTNPEQLTLFTCD